MTNAESHMEGKGMNPVETHKKMVAHRERSGVVAPTLGNVRLALKGKTYKRGLAESRGRKRKLSNTNVRALDKARKSLIRKADGATKVHWRHIVRKARVPKVDLTTAARALKRLRPDVQWRRPREKPVLTKEHKWKRLEICREWQKKLVSYFKKLVDLYIDNKTFVVPTHRGAAARNPGASVKICAGIMGGQVKLWHQLPQQWNRKIAADLYRGPIKTTVTANSGGKRRYTLLEGNDPTGYKSRKGKAAKDEVGLCPLRFPKYSPDLNPLDFFIWSEIERRAL